MSSESAQRDRPETEGAPASAPANAPARDPDSDPDPEVEVEVTRAVAGGPGSPVGRFRYDVAARSWWLSEGLPALDGLGKDEEVLTADPLHAHQEDGDDLGTGGDLVPIRGPDGVFSRRHRIRDAQGMVRTLVLVGQAQRDEHQQVVAVVGYVADVSAEVRCAAARETTEAVERSALTRAVIEQAKGVVMAIRRMSADDAFELLRWHSQHANLKLRDLASMIVEQVPRAPRERHEAALDRLLDDVLRRHPSTCRSSERSARGGRDT